MPAKFTIWPGKTSAGKVEVTEGSENYPLSVTVEPKGIPIRWYRTDEQGNTEDVAAGNDFELNTDRTTLTIKKVSASDAGEWHVSLPGDLADPKDTDPQKTFTLSVKAKEAEDDDDDDDGGGGQPVAPREPGEYDKNFAKAAAGIGAALVAGLILALVVLVAVVGQAEDDWADRVPAVLAIFLILVGTVALVASIVLAALEVRARSRTREAVETTAEATRGRGLDPAPVLEAGEKLIKAYGALTEVAALSIAALLLYGGAFALVLLKFPDVGGESESKAAPAKPAAITVLVPRQTAGARRCTVRLMVNGRRTGRVRRGAAKVTLMDRARRCGAELAGRGIRLASGTARTGTSTTDVRLLRGRYAITSLRRAKGKLARKRSGRLVVS